MERRPCPEDSAGFFSRLLFAWIGPTLSAGYQTPLSENDITAPPKSDAISTRAERITGRLLQFKQSGPDQRRGPMKEMMAALMEADGGTFVRIGVLRPIWLVCVVLQVVCMRFLGAKLRRSPSPA